LIVAQFYLFFRAGFVLRFSAYLLIPPFTLFRRIVVITVLATQLLVGYGIARYGKTRALGICLIVAALDCALGPAARHSRRTDQQQRTGTAPAPIPRKPVSIR
jgi:hypothetical protein